MPMSPNVEMIASICSASTRSSGRWSLISEYVRKPRSLPSLMRFLRRVRRVSASSFGSSGGMSQASFLPLRPGRPLPLVLTAATLASRSSSACFALPLPFFLSSAFGAAAFGATAGFFAAIFLSGFLAALGAAWAFFFRCLILSAFFLLCCVRLGFDLRLGLAILPREYPLVRARAGKKSARFYPTKTNLRREKSVPAPGSAGAHFRLESAPFLGRGRALQDLLPQQPVGFRHPRPEALERFPELAHRVVLGELELHMEPGVRAFKELGVARALDELRHLSLGDRLRVGGAAHDFDPLVHGLRFRKRRIEQRGFDLKGEVGLREHERQELALEGMGH